MRRREEKERTRTESAGCIICKTYALPSPARVQCPTFPTPPSNCCPAISGSLRTSRPITAPGLIVATIDAACTLPILVLGFSLSSSSHHVLVAAFVATALASCSRVRRLSVGLSNAEHAFPHARP